jgi:signal transduction histidine kinase
VIRISTGEDHGDAWIRIADDGPGIPDGLREVLLDSEFPPIEDDGEAGLGLAICREIVKEHGGRFELEKVERGTSFLITLPRPDEGNRGDP